MVGATLALGAPAASAAQPHPGARPAFVVDGRPTPTREVVADLVTLARTHQLELVTVNDEGDRVPVEGVVASWITKLIHAEVAAAELERRGVTVSTRAPSPRSTVRTTRVRTRRVDGIPAPLPEPSDRADRLGDRVGAERGPRPHQAAPGRDARSSRWSRTSPTRRPSWSRPGSAPGTPTWPSSCHAPRVLRPSVPSRPCAPPATRRCRRGSDRAAACPVRRMS